LSRILIVEDSRAQAEALRQTLVQAGYDVEAAPDGEKALAALRASAFDLVLTDIVMPGICGYDLCRQIKQDPGWRKLPVVLLTALRGPADMVRGLECGADSYIPKPWQPEDLIRRVETIFASKALRAQGGPTDGVLASCMGQAWTFTAGREQILDLLLAACEDLARAKREVEASRAQLQVANARLEKRNDVLMRQARAAGVQAPRGDPPRNCSSNT
jgi:DNA-binding response OmpR family regulator